MKSVVFNNVIFPAQDCIGASITISILIYMKIYRDKDLYNMFVETGKENKVGLVINCIITILLVNTFVFPNIINFLAFFKIVPLIIIAKFFIILFYLIFYAVNTIDFVLITAYPLSIIDNKISKKTI